MKKIFFLATLLLIVCTSTKGQQLTVGDTMPDLKNLRYFKDGKYIDIELKWDSPKMKDKLVIFDFWSPGCSPCIAGLPKMDNLQKKFGDKIVIFPIVNGPAEIVENVISEFWIKSSFTKRSTSLGTLVEATENKILYKYFPNASLPYEVWVKNGKVIGLTGTAYVNEKEIAAILKGETRNWAIEPGVELRKNVYDYQVPLKDYLIQDKACTLLKQSMNSVFGSKILSKSGALRDNFSDQQRAFSKLTLLNQSVTDFYRYAFILSQPSSKRIPNNNNRIIIEVKNTSNFSVPANEYPLEWEKKHLYCYELILPADRTKEQMLNHMIQDLNTFFGLDGRLEKRKVKCWVITRNANKPGFERGLTDRFNKERYEIMDRIGITSYQAERDERDKIRGWSEWPETSMLTITERLNMQISDFPVIDESGYTGDLDFIFRLGPKITFKDYQRQLEKNGFDLKIKERELEMLVITENGYKAAQSK